MLQGIPSVDVDNEGNVIALKAGTATIKAVVTCGTLTETVTLTINLDVEVPALDTGDFEENPPFYIVATNGNGDLHFNGTIADGRYGGKYTAAEAVKVYVEKADNGLYIYFLDGTTKTYIVTKANRRNSFRNNYRLRTTSR